MSRIHQAFENKKAFIAFVTGGDPDLETTEKLVIAMEEAGADLIEIGIPFSDPIAEGVVNQEANIRALSAGCTTDKLFETVPDDILEVVVIHGYRKGQVLLNMVRKDFKHPRIKQKVIPLNKGITLFLV